MAPGFPTERRAVIALWAISGVAIALAAGVAFRHNSLNVIWLCFSAISIIALGARAWTRRSTRLVQSLLLFGAVICSGFYPLPLTSLGINIVHPARSTEVVTGTLGAVHRKTKISAWTTRGADRSRVAFLRKTPLNWNTPTQFVTFGHRGGSYVVSEIWFGTDVLRVPFKLARLRGQSILKSAHLPATTGQLQPTEDGYRVVNRFDANPLFRLKADRGFVSTHIQRRLEWPVRFLWLLAFIAVIVAGSAINRWRFDRTW